MKFYKQNINGVFIIKPEPFEDHRGLFRRHFCQNEFKAHSLFTEIQQTNISENHKAFTLRGFHFQHPPKYESKVISCLTGSLFDIVVDLRPDSPTYLQWQQFELSADSRASIYVPEGCANAWMTLADNTCVLYYHSEFFSPGYEGGIRYDDPLFKFKWPREPAVISDKDKSYPNFKPSEKTS
jgi:dTDP-4-dehydrorhamnose 3,5-epimerase